MATTVTTQPNEMICNNVQHELFSRLKYLRMLSFSGCFLSKLADEISNLQFLRYLNLSDTGITSLPNSICKLYNLQTLILANCRLDELPSNFYKLINLRHLDLDGTYIKKMPKHIGRLNHLQVLTHFAVGEQSGQDIKELETLNHLQGTLYISGLKNVANPADAAIANLKDKKYLEKLYIKYAILEMSAAGVNDDSIIGMHAFVLEALQPNINLNGLTVDDYYGKSFPSWLGGCHLPTLVSLNLRGCKFCTRLPPLGQLPSLKKLFIRGCDEIEIIGEEFYGNTNSLNVAFRCLEILQFDSMFKWKEWLCLEGCFPLLKELCVTRCGKLKGSLPHHLPVLLKLVVTNCGELEASIPKAGNVRELDISGTRIIELSLEQFLMSNAFIKKLHVGDFDGANLKCSSLDLISCNSLHTIVTTYWCPSSFPFELQLFTNLHYRTRPK